MLVAFANYKNLRTIWKAFNNDAPEPLVRWIGRCAVKTACLYKFPQIYLNIIIRGLFERAARRN